MNKSLYSVPAGFAAAASVKRIDYERLYVESVEHPERFLGRIGRRIDWIKDFSRVKETSFLESDFHTRWFSDGKLNVSSNCLARHLEARGAKPTIIWAAASPNSTESISSRQLCHRGCQARNASNS